MKRLITICTVAALMLAATSAAQASYVSTINITLADFNLTGFSDTTNTPPTPTAGPDTMTITNVSGSYDLSIPAAGGSWDVYIDGWTKLDFDKNGTWDCTIDYDNELVGTYASPGEPVPSSGNYDGTEVYVYTLSLDNVQLTAWDNALGGGDGVINGWEQSEITVTCVPEPATIALLGLGGLLLRRKHT